MPMNCRKETVKRAECEIEAQLIRIWKIFIPNIRLGCKGEFVKTDVCYDFR